MVQEDLQGAQTHSRLKNACRNIKQLITTVYCLRHGQDDRRRRGRSQGCVSPSKAISTKVHYDNLRLREWMGSSALAIVPNTRKLICDKLILATFIFDFLSELCRTIKMYPNRKESDRTRRSTCHLSIPYKNSSRVDLI